MKIERTFRGSVYLTLTPAMQIRHICIDIPTDPQGFYGSCTTITTIWTTPKAYRTTT